MDDQGFSVVAHDRNRARITVLQLNEAAGGSWTGSLVGTMEHDQQPQKIQVVASTAFVMSITDILALDRSSGLATSIGMGFDGSSRYPVEMAGVEGRLHVLIRSFPLPMDRSMEWTTLDLSDSTDWRSSLPVRVNHDPSVGARLFATASHAALVGPDTVRIYEAEAAAIRSEPTSSIVTAAVSAAYLTTDELVVSSFRGLCGFDLTLPEPSWCIETGLPSRKLIPSGQFTFGLGHRGLLYVAQVGKAGVTITSQLGHDVPTHLFADAIETQDGILVVVDINPPRTDKVRFRVDHLEIDQAGEMAILHQDVVDTHHCGNVKLAGVGSWLGVLCGQQILEYSRGPAGLEGAGTFNLATHGTTLDVYENMVVAGTTSGLQLFDRLSRQEIPVRLNASVPDPQVLATGATGGCVIVIQGRQETRQVVEYCEVGDGSYEGEVIFQYEINGRGSEEQIIPAPGGLVLVTVHGTAIYLRRESVQHRAYLPMLQLDR